MEIGNKIKDLRVQKGLTQEELADRAELSKGFISQLERDLTSPSIATLIDLLQVLGTTPKDFFDDESENQIVFHKRKYLLAYCNFEFNKQDYDILVKSCYKTR